MSHFGSSFYGIHKFEPELVRICEIDKTSNNLKLWNRENEARDQLFEEKKDKIYWFESVKSRKRMHIRSHGNRLFRIAFVKSSYRPRSNIFQSRPLKAINPIFRFVWSSSEQYWDPIGRWRYHWTFSQTNDTRINLIRSPCIHTKVLMQKSKMILWSTPFPLWIPYM